MVPLLIPPLRERTDDIPLLARHFLRHYIAKYHHAQFTLTREDDIALQAYDWPGNVRELQNVLERASLLSSEGKLELNLPKTQILANNHPFEDLPTMEEMQRRYIRYVLDRTRGKQSGPDGADKILGMKRSTLYNRMKKLKIN